MTVVPGKVTVVVTVEEDPGSVVVEVSVVVCGGKVEVIV
jgi:hypothetical protein